MNHDASATQGRRVVANFWAARLVVIDNSTRTLDLDAKLINATAARFLTVNCRHQELIRTGPIQRSDSLDLSSGAINHQPFVGGTVKAQIRETQSELCFTCRNRVVLLVLAYETKVHLAGENGIARKGSGGRLNPSSASDELSFGIIDGDQETDRCANVAHAIAAALELPSPA